jgi:rod shape determining protein RodA
LVVAGWFAICGASYTYGEPDFFDFSTRAGKQLVWIVCSFGLAFVLLMLDDNFYDVFAYLIYAVCIGLLILTLFVAGNVKGSHSWIQLGSVSLQPAEFAKFATGLALAKLMNGYGFTLHRWRNVFNVVFIILLPMTIIILQDEMGSALVYLAFFLVLYREGMPGVVLFAGLCAVSYFIVGIRYDEFAVLSIILFVEIAMLALIGRKWAAACYWLAGMCALFLLGYLLLAYEIRLPSEWIVLAMIVVFSIWLLYISYRERIWRYAGIVLFAFGSVCFLYLSDYIFDDVLKDYQRVRIEVLLGVTEDPSGAGYNVNQSKIAIGSGGLLGKGFLNGTQTKLKYVPEQDTDFIFCTIGEEKGFVGSMAVLLVFLILIWRLIAVAERQRNTFGRVYAYSVLSIFLFHLFINVGMVLGLTPVIGIPLPFLSYGGSSLWGFTILLFILLRIDAGRSRR